MKKNFTLKDNHWFVLCLIIVAILLVYSNSFKNPFISDDTILLTNPGYHNLKSFFNDPSQRNVSALTTASYVLNWQLSNGNVISFHITNTLIHIINSILVYFLILVLFGRISLAGLTSFLFAIHPVNNQVVAWVSARPYSLSAFFYLFAFLCFVKSADLKNKKEIISYMISPFVFIIGFYAQPAVFSLPLILFLYVIFINPGKSLFELKKRLSMIVPFAVMIFVAVPSILNYFLSHNNQYGELAAKYGINSGINLGKLVVVSKSIFYYLKLFVFPAKLGFYHPGHFEYTKALEVVDFSAIVSILAVLSLIIFAFLIFKKAKPLAFGILFFIITILPFTNIVYLHSIVSERYAYLASLGYCLAFSYLILMLALFVKSKFKGAAAKHIPFILVFLILFSYGLRTYLRNFDWKDWESFYSNEVRLDPESKFAHNSLGGTISDEKPLLAIEEFKKAIALDALYFEARFNLAQVFTQSGRLDEAAEQYKKAIELAPQFLRSYENLALLYLAANKLLEAESCTKLAISISPKNPLYYNNLGVIYYKMGSIDQALIAFQTALLFEPNYQPSQVNIQAIKEKK